MKVTRNLRTIISAITTNTTLIIVIGKSGNFPAIHEMTTYTIYKMASVMRTPITDSIILIRLKPLLITI